MRALILEEGVRPDGRGVTEVRPIRARAGLLPRTHGSALFTRGETQAIAVTTLGTILGRLCRLTNWHASNCLKHAAICTGSQDSAMRQDLMSGDWETPRKFYMQYSFPPSCVGEVGRTGQPGRREIGHGMLAERALTPTIPPEVHSFPACQALQGHHVYQGLDACSLTHCRQTSHTRCGWRAPSQRAMAPPPWPPSVAGASLSWMPVGPLAPAFLQPSPLLLGATRCRAQACL